MLNFDEVSQQNHHKNLHYHFDVPKVMEKWGPENQKKEEHQKSQLKRKTMFFSFPKKHLMNKPDVWGVLGCDAYYHAWVTGTPNRQKICTLDKFPPPKKNRYPK